MIMISSLLPNESRLFLHPYNYGVYLFDLMGFHQRHLRLRPTPNAMVIQDFHLYSLSP